MRRTLIIAAWGCWLSLLGRCGRGAARGDGTGAQLRPAAVARSRPAPAAPTSAKPLSYSLNSDDLPSEAASPKPLQEAAELPAPSREAEVAPYHEGEQFGECCDDGHCHVLDWINWDDCDCCMLLRAVRRMPIEARGEYLMWWVEGQATPPLVTTSPADTPRARPAS